MFSPGQVLSFENLVYSIFDFVTVLVEAPKFRNSVKQGLDDLVYYVIVYGQITEDQVRRVHGRVLKGRSVHSVITANYCYNFCPVSLVLPLYVHYC